MYTASQKVRRVLHWYLRQLISAAWTGKGKSLAPHTETAFSHALPFFPSIRDRRGAELAMTHSAQDKLFIYSGLSFARSAYPGNQLLAGRLPRNC